MGVNPPTPRAKSLGRLLQIEGLVEGMDSKGWQEFLILGSAPCLLTQIQAAWFPRFEPKPSKTRNTILIHL